MSLIRDVGDYLISAGQADLGHFPDGGIRLFGRTGHDLGADTPAKWVLAQGRGLTFRLRIAAWLADKLIDCWHGYGFELRKSGEPRCLDFDGKFFLERNCQRLKRMPVALEIRQPAS